MKLFWKSLDQCCIMIKNRSNFGLKLYLLLVSYETKVRPYGCIAYACVSDAKQSGKFDRQSIPCVFVGYLANDYGFKF